MFKKYQNLFSYIKTVNKNRETYSKRYNMKFDWIYRGYTVLNFPDDVMTNVEKYGYDYLDSEVKRYVLDLNVFNKEIGLLELIELDKADQIAPGKVLIVVRYRFLNTKKLVTRVITTSILLLLAAIGLLIFF